MTKILFEYDGDGYSIWMEFPDDDEVASIGFSTIFDVEHHMAYYREQGYEVTKTGG